MNTVFHKTYTCVCVFIYIKCIKFSFTYPAALMIRPTEFRLKTALKQLTL